MKTFLVLLILLILLVASPCLAVPTFDAEAHATSTGVSSLSFSLTVTLGCANPIVIPSVSWQINPHGLITSMTVGGAGATLITSSDFGGGTDIEIDIWQRTGVAVNTPLTIAVAFDSSPNSVTFTASSYCNVHQGSPIGTPVSAFNAASSPASVVVTSAVGELVISAMVGFYSTTSITSANTQRSNFFEGTGTNHIHGTSDATGAATVTPSWTLGAGDQDWMILGVSLKPPAAGGGLPLRHKVQVQ